MQPLNMGVLPRPQKTTMRRRAKLSCQLRFLRKVGTWIWIAICIFCWVSIVIRILRGHGIERGIQLLAVAFLLFAGWFRKFIWDSRWWLVPGGLVHRKDCAYKRNHRIDFFTPLSASLILDLRESVGCVINSKRTVSFNFCENYGPYILQGWRSTESRPTESEMASFLGWTKISHEMN